MNMGEQIVIFKLDNNLFGIPVYCVNEIINCQSLSNIPNRPAFVDGITNLRGRVITVVNLRKRFGFATSPNSIFSGDQGTEEKIILVEGTNIGFRVDSVEEIVIPGKDEVIEPDAFQKDLNESFIWKLFKHNERVVVVLDPQDIIHNTHVPKQGELSLADKISQDPSFSLKSKEEQIEKEAILV